MQAAFGCRFPIGVFERATLTRLAVFRFGPTRRNRTVTVLLEIGGGPIFIDKPGREPSALVGPKRVVANLTLLPRFAGARVSEWQLSL